MLEIEKIILKNKIVDKDNYFVLNHSIKNMKMKSNKIIMLIQKTL